MKREIALVVAGVLGLSAPAAAQLPPPPTVQVQLIEWDVDPSTGDVVPGAVSVDDKSSSQHSKVWFVTRQAPGIVGGTVRLYRLTPALKIKHDPASAKSWDLGAQTTGGLRLRHSDDGRYAFVNVLRDELTTGAVVAVDTSNDTRITWKDRPAYPQISDVAVDTRGGYVTIFTAAPYYDATEFPGVDGVVQRLKPGTPQLRSGQWVVPAQVTRYPLGGGAGSCDDTGPGAPCIPGIAVDRRRGAPIYVSEPKFVNADGSKGAIAEIDPKGVPCPTNPSAICVRTRHWPLPAVTSGPREIRVDDTGKVWGITSSGHLFSLEIEKNCDRARVTLHNPAGPIDPEDLFAVAPSGGVIGFTDSNNNEVSVLMPERTSKPVTPRITYPQPVTRTIDGDREIATPTTHLVTPRLASATGVSYSNPEDGSYVETDIATAINTTGNGSPNPSFIPTGMASNGNWKTGGFFYGVTFADGSNRIGHIYTRVGPNTNVDHRRSDHDFDHDGVKDEDDNDMDDDGLSNATDTDNDNDGIPDVFDNDKNDDGIDDQYQSPGHRETQRSDSGQMAAGETREYEMEYDAHSISLLAVFEATSATAPLSIEILDDDGLVVVSAPAVLGKAVATAVPALPGVYTVRVKNTGSTPVTYKTTIIGTQVPY
jgi:hypothetical protein